MAGAPEDLCGSILEKINAVGIPGEIEPELIRPRALHSRHRKALTELETLFDNALEAMIDDKRVPGVLCKLADLHLSEGDYAKAILKYEVCLGFNSRLPEAWVHMGMAYYLVGEYRDAVSCFGSALAVDKRNMRALTYLAMAQIELRNYEEGLKNIEKALMLSPNNSRALMAKGLYFKKRGKTEGAITWFKRAIESKNDFIPAYMELGAIHYENDQLDQAEEALVGALHVDPEQPYAMALLGDVAIKKKDFNEALFYYDKAVGVKFDEPALWIRKGDVHKLMRSYKEALNAYSKAINADPENIEAWVKSGNVLLLMSDESAALEYFNTALALAPDNSEVAHSRGIVYFNQEGFEEALSDFDAAFSVDPGNPEHLYYRALCLEKLERNPEARRTWQIASSLYLEAGDEVKSAECNARAKRLSKVIW